MNDLFGLPNTLWGALCLLVAAVYTVIRPRLKEGAPARPVWRQAVLLWGHMGVWVLLALSFFLRAVWPAAGAVADVVALASLVLYAVFTWTLLRERRQA